MFVRWRGPRNANVGNVGNRKVQGGLWSCEWLSGTRIDDVGSRFDISGNCERLGGSGGLKGRVLVAEWRENLSVG